MRTPLLATVCALSVLAISATVADAASVLDQEVDSASFGLSGAIGDLNTFDQAQTFTVGITGTLTRVEVRIQRDAASITEPLLFDIRTTTGGSPTEPDSGGNILFSGTIAPGVLPLSPSPFPAFTGIDLGAGAFAVTSGDVLALVFRSDDANEYSWVGRFLTPYIAGTRYGRSGSGSWVASTNIDLAFRTFVDATPVPEPSSLSLVGVGLAGLASRRRRMHRRNA